MAKDVRLKEAEVSLVTKPDTLSYKRKCTRKTSFFLKNLVERNFFR